MNSEDLPRPLTPQQSMAFDAMVEEVIGHFPPALAELVDQVAVIVLDRPEPHVLNELGIDPGDHQAILEICGMHSGIPDTYSSVEDGGDLPPQIHLFREAIIDLCEGLDPDNPESMNRVREEIIITLLHEIGHQFGLDEDDLDRLGYQ